MGLEINANQSLAGVSSNFFINPIQQKRNDFSKYVGVDNRPDSVSTNTDLSKYANKQAIVDMIKANPQIIKILNDSQMPININMKVLDDLNKNHLPETKKATIGIVNNLPQEFKSAVNYQALQKAAVLHDIGKVLIPEAILNKNGNLDEKEFNIMQNHAILGYEMLKTTDLDSETLELIKNHHQNAQQTGYPNVSENFVANINTQILSTADMYSALREKRAYKSEMGKNQALAIIHKEMKAGKIHPAVFKALVDFANKQENLTVINPQGQIADYQTANRLSA